MTPDHCEIVVFSDTHLGFDQPVRPRSHRVRRGPDFFANWQRVLSVAVQRRVAAVIHCGDLFFRSKVPQPIVDRVYAEIHTFLEHDIPLVIVPGNHERARLPTSLFLAHPRLHIFDRPRTFTLSCGDRRIAVGGFPSVRNGVRDVFAASYAATGLDTTAADMRLLCLHQTIEGAHVGPGNFVFRDGPDVIPRRLLPDGIDAVLTGHIHRRQEHTYRRRPAGPAIPILMPGSIERTSFAEKDEAKGYYVLRIAEGARDRMLTWQFHDLPARPMVEWALPEDIAPSAVAPWLARQFAADARDAQSPGPSAVRSQVSGTYDLTELSRTSPKLSRNSRCRGAPPVSE